MHPLLLFYLCVLMYFCINFQLIVVCIFATQAQVKKDCKRYKLTPQILFDFTAGNRGRPTQRVANAFCKFLSAPPAGDAALLKRQGKRGREIGVAMAEAEQKAFEALLAGMEGLDLS